MLIFRGMGKIFCGESNEFGESGFGRRRYIVVERGDSIKVGGEFLFVYFGY